MKIVTMMTAAALLATPALAQTAPNDTLTVVVANGISMNAMGSDFTIDFKPDGTWEGFGGMAGNYTVEGDNLCISSDQGEACSVYPAGKKSGDKFPIELGPLGMVDVTIR